MKAYIAAHPEHKARISAKGRSQTPETRAKLSAIHIGMKHTPEARAKMSASKTGRRVHSLEDYARWGRERRGHPAHFPKRRFYYAGEAFRSSWEERVARALDALGVRWEYEKKRFDLGTQTYAPDFYLPDGECYWEVKGYYGPKSRHTVALFREHYPDEILLIVDERAMVALEAAARVAA